MITPSTYAWTEGETLGQHFESRGVSRRDFVKFCTEIAVVLGLGSAAGPRVLKALEAVKRPSVIWLQLQECTGCVESVLRTANPTIGDLLLDVVSLDYNHTLMAGAGAAVERAKQSAIAANKGKYVLVVTGSIPTKEGGIYTMVGGRTAEDLVKEAAEGAAAILAVGACAHWGSVQAPTARIAAAPSAASFTRSSAVRPPTIV